MYPRKSDAIYDVVVVGRSVGNGTMTDSSTRGCLAVSDICACCCLRRRFRTSTTPITLASMKSEPTMTSATTALLHDDSSISGTTTMGRGESGGEVGRGSREGESGGGVGRGGGGCDAVDARYFKGYGIDVYPTLPTMMSRRKQRGTQYMKSKARKDGSTQNGTRHKVLLGHY